MCNKDISTVYTQASIKHTGRYLLTMPPKEAPLDSKPYRLTVVPPKLSHQTNLCIDSHYQKRSVNSQTDPNEHSIRCL